VTGIVAGYVGLVTVLIVRITTVEDQFTYSREQQVREACGLSSRGNRTWASICEASSSELSSLASALDVQPPIVAACSPDYQVVEFVLSQRLASPQASGRAPLTLAMQKPLSISSLVLSDTPRICTERCSLSYVSRSILT
jgi:hypothetical protein